MKARYFTTDQYSARELAASWAKNWEPRCRPLPVEGKSPVLARNRRVAMSALSLLSGAKRT
jgi:hypothetical protein